MAAPWADEQHGDGDGDVNDDGGDDEIGAVAGEVAYHAITRNLWMSDELQAVGMGGVGVLKLAVVVGDLKAVRSQGSIDLGIR